MALTPVHSKAVVLVLLLLYLLFVESLFTVARIVGVFTLMCRGRENELLYLNSLSDVL